jgi:hypothetical protein
MNSCSRAYGMSGKQLRSSKEGNDTGSARVKGSIDTTNIVFKINGFNQFEFIKSSRSTALSQQRSLSHEIV